MLTQYQGKQMFFILATILTMGNNDFESLLLSLSSLVDYVSGSSEITKLDDDVHSSCSQIRRSVADFSGPSASPLPATETSAWTIMVQM